MALAMTVFDRAEAVRCPQCALAGVASFTDDRTEMRLPEGFKVVTTEKGNQVYCVTCNRPAITLPLDR